MPLHNLNKLCVYSTPCLPNCPCNVEEMLKKFIKISNDLFMFTFVTCCHMTSSKVLYAWISYIQIQMSWSRYFFCHWYVMQNGSWCITDMLLLLETPFKTMFFQLSIRGCYKHFDFHLYLLITNLRINKIWIDTNGY